MTITRAQTLRSSTAGNRPAVGSRQPGELYTNWPDRQIGVIDSTQTPMDLVAVRFFSTLATYAVGDQVWNGGYLYRCITAVTVAGAFTPANWAQHMTVAGGTMTGALICTANNPSITVQPSAGQAAAITLNKAASGIGDNIYGATAGLNRWVLQLGDGTAESGSNAGSNFSLSAYNDAGTIVSPPALNIVRSSGLVTAGGLTGIAIQPPASQNALLQLYKPATGYGCQINTFTGSNMRWSQQMGDATAETGSDTGSNYSLYAFKDNASYTLALSISRATGLATVAADPTSALGIATKQYVDSHASCVKITGGTISNAANMILTLPAGYSSYRLVLRHIEPTVAATLVLAASTNGGSTFWQSTGNYSWTQKYTTQTGESYSSGTSVSNTSIIYISPGNQQAASNYPGFFVIDIDPGLTATASPGCITYQGVSGLAGGTACWSAGGGYLSSGTTWTNVALYYTSAGNIYGCKYELYGYV